MLSLPSIMPPKSFAEVPPAEAFKRSTFDRTHGHSTTFDVDYLVPFMWDEILPGDTVSISPTVFARLSSSFNLPLMDNMYIDCFAFFCPWRILWLNFKAFLGEQDPFETEPTEYLLPCMNGTPSGTGWPVGSLGDYFGIPTGVFSANAYDTVSVGPFRSYNQIYTWWFRDQDLQDPVPIILDDGPDDPADYVLLKRNKKRDYFTSARPWPQKGEEVTFSGSSAYQATIQGTGKSLGLTEGTNFFGMYSDDATPGVSRARYSADAYNVNVGTAVAAGDDVVGDDAIGVTTNPAASGIVANILASNAISINQFRELITQQRYLELNARSGTRYTEYVNAHFGVTVPDYLVQIPEFLWSHSERIDITPVTMQNSATSPTIKSGLGQQGAYATMVNRGHFSKSFVEHGILMLLVNIRADIRYQNGLARKFSRRTKYDIYDPIFANLGEQAILNQEILWKDNSTGSDTGVFGYQERWAEYRHFPSLITGKLRSTASGTLDAYHLSQNFGTTVPDLDSDFIKQATPISRTLLVTTEPNIIFDSYIKYIHSRIMPVYSIPGLDRL